ncbi:MAG: tetratricopeptide repeat protein [Desulfobulbus sp.]
MNGSLLAVLGVIVLLVVVLILKMRAGRSKTEMQAKGEPESSEVEAALPVSLEEPEGVETDIEPLATEAVEQEQAAKEETPPVSWKELPEPCAETVLPEAIEVESRPEEEAKPEPVAEDVAEVEPEEVAAVEEAVLAEEIAASEAEPPAPSVAEEEPALQEEILQPTIEPTPEEPVEGAEAAEVEEIAKPAVEPAPREPEPIEQTAAEPSSETGVTPEPVTSVKPAETVLPLVRLSMEAYGEQLVSLEEQHRAALAEAVERHDDQRRDQLQRELVIMNERLELLADHYVEEMACYQQILDTLARLQTEEPSPALAQAIAELQTGKTEAATAFLEELSGQSSHPLAVQAAFLSGQLAECRVDLQKAMDYYRRAVDKEPDNPQYLRAAGLMARSLYRYQEALPWLESYVRLIRENGQADAKAVALAQRELAYTYVLSGKYQKAGPLYKESMTVLAQKLGQDHPEMAISWQQIGEFQETMGEYDKAVSLYKKALAILEKKRGAEHPALAGILRKLAALCVELELEPEAVPLYEKLVRIQEKTLRPTHPQLVIGLNNLAEAYRLQGRYAEAEACYLKTLKINEEVHGGEHPSVAAILQELAKLCTSQRKPEEANRYQERASAIFQKSVEAAEQKAGTEEALTLELS